MDSPTPQSHQEAPGPRRPDEFDAAYASTPPWDIGRPQSAFLHLAESGLLRGRVLDVGCGTGEHALMAASLGLEAAGIDLSPTAIGLAQRKAQARSLTARFLVWDALELADLREQFDTVLDCGLFHTFDDGGRQRLVESLRSAVAPGGRYYMLCFSDRQPGSWGPRRVTESELRGNFANGWRVESIAPSTIEINIYDGRAQAWLAILARN